MSTTAEPVELPRSAGNGVGGGRRSRLPSAAIESPLILFVCTANQCRSPLAEALLRSLLTERRIGADVASAGLMAGGMPATETGVDVLVGRGIEAGRHRSRNIADPDVRLSSADVIIGMERRHVQEVVLLDPALERRAFTLIDLVRRAEAAPPRQDGVRLRAWAEGRSTGRRRSELLGVGDDAVADPIGRGRDTYEATADLLVDLLGRLVGRAFPAAVAGGVEARSA